MAIAYQIHIDVDIEVYCLADCNPCRTMFVRLVDVGVNPFGFFCMSLGFRWSLTNSASTAIQCRVDGNTRIMNRLYLGIGNFALYIYL